MSRERWLLSGLILYHLTAVSLAALPPPEALQIFDASRRQGAGGRFPSAAFDSLASFARRAEAVALASSRPVSRITQPYIGAGLHQRWDMFSNPATDDHYVRLDYHVVTAGGAVVYQELVFPAGDETRVRLGHKFEDKAIAGAFENFLLAIRKGTFDGRAAVPGSEKLVPIARHFSRRFVVDRLPAGDRLGRTEIWYGSAPIPPRSERLDPGTFAARLEALRRYRGVPVSLVLKRRHSVGEEERDADIRWKLALVTEQP